MQSKVALEKVTTVVVFWFVYVCVSFKFNGTSPAIQFKPHRTQVPGDVITLEDMYNNFGSAGGVSV